MRLTRSLEERLVSLHRQGKLVGGVFRSLGQEADSVGSAYALERRDVLSSLTRNLGSLLVKGATPLEILRQHLATADSPTGGRDLGLHIADLQRGFLGHISPLGDMVPVTAGVALSFRMRGEDRVALVYVGDGNDVLGVYDVTRRAGDRARAGGGVTLIELLTYRRRGHAEHDNQRYVPAGEAERRAAENDPLDPS